MIRRAAAVLAAILLAVPPLAAAPFDGAQVQALIRAALAQAGQRGQPELSARRGFPPCDHAPQVAPFNHGWQTVQLSCDSPAWTRAVRIRSAAAALRDPAAGPGTPQTRALVLTESLPRGTVLAPRHLKWGEIPEAGADGLVTELQAAVGRTLRTNLGAGSPLLARHLEHDWQVEQGAPVTIAAETGGIRIETGGIALDSGQLGERIRASNSSSGRVLEVIVTGPNKVTVRPNMR